MKAKVLLFANTDWYLYNFRRALAIALRESGYEIVLISPPGPYGEKLLSLGFKWLPAPMYRRSLNPFRELRLVIWLWRLISIEQADLIHNFTIKNAIYGSLAASFSRKSSSINAVAGMGYVFTSTDLKAKFLSPIVRFLMRTTLNGDRSRLILQNPDDVEFFETQKLIDKNKIFLIYGSGVNCDRFNPSAKSSSPDTRIRVLLPARLLWDKGIAEFVAAAKIIKAKNRNIDFLLAGNPDPGNPASVPRNQLECWQREGLVQWLGHVDDMPMLFRDVDIVVLPSYREGLPKGLIEAAACGLPIITTDVPGCRTVVSHEEDGLLVKKGSIDDLAESILRLCNQPELRQRLGYAARQKALAIFDETHVIQQTIGVYKELLSSLE